MANGRIWSEKSLSRRAALRSAAAAGGGLVALSLVGCGDSNDGDKGTPQSNPVRDSTKGQPGGTLKLMLSSPMTNLALAEQITGSAPRMGGLVQSGLLAFRWGQEGIAPDDYSLEPDLAVAMPEQPDDTTLIFKLRSGVKFHNGRSFSAEDVSYSFDRHGNYEKSPYKRTLQTWFDKLETPDPETVKITTKFPIADALESCGGGADTYILCKELEESTGAITTMIGTGPYTFFEGAPPVSWTFKKNPDYYLKPYPYFDEIIGYAAPDPVKRIANFTTRQVQQAWVVYADDRDTIKQARPDAKQQINPWVGTSIFMRTDRPPLNDKRVRQAMSMTIDRKKVRDAVMQGEGEPDQFFPRVFARLFGARAVADLGAAAKNWDFDPTEAKKLLSAAGVEKPIESDYFHYVPAIVGQWFVDQATIAQATWKELGVANIKLVPQLPPAFASQALTGNYEGMGQLPTPNVPGYQRGPYLKDLVTWGANGEHSPRNISYINNPKLNELADKQLRQLKFEDRKDTFREIEDIAADELYRLHYSTTTQNWFTDPSLVNAAQPPEITVSYRYAMKWWFA